MKLLEDGQEEIESSLLVDGQYARGDEEDPSQEQQPQQQQQQRGERDGSEDEFEIEGIDGKDFMQKKSEENSSGKSDIPQLALLRNSPKESWSIIVFCLMEGISTTCLIPFLVFIVRSFGISEDAVGYYVGFLTAANFFALFLSSFLWGKVSDQIGRRPVLLLATLSNAIFIFLFGFSTSLYLAAFFRFCNGFFNGSLGIVKAYAREVTTQDTQAVMFSFRSIGYGVGFIIGPLVGGYLSRPSENFNSVFGGEGIFGAFPFLLPCIVASLLNFIGLAVCYFILQESLENPVSISEYLRSFSFSSSSSSSSPSSSSSSSSSLSPSTTEENSSNEGPSLRRVLREESIIICMVLYFINGTVSVILTEISNLLTTREIEKGGLGFKEKNIGQMMALAAVGGILFQLFLYAPLDKSIGTLWLTRVGLSIGFFPVLALPWVNLLVRDELLGSVGVWILVQTIFVMNRVMASCAFSSMNLMISNVAPPDQVGLVNGFAASGTCFTRMFAPLIGGFSFAQFAKISSLTTNTVVSIAAIGVPFDMVALAIVCMWTLTLFMDRRVVNFRRLSKTGEAAGQVVERELEMVLLTVHEDSDSEE